MNKLQAFFNRLMKYHDIDKTIKYEIQKDYEFIKNHSHIATDNDRVQNEGNRRTKRTDNTKSQSKHITTTTNK
jgi:hypothetical protein